jgi:hypothetical protein
MVRTEKTGVKGDIGFRKISVASRNKILIKNW